MKDTNETSFVIVDLLAEFRFSSKIDFLRRVVKFCHDLESRNSKHRKLIEGQFDPTTAEFVISKDTHGLTDTVKDASWNTEHDSKPGSWQA